MLSSVRGWGWTCTPGRWWPGVIDGDTGEVSSLRVAPDDAAAIVAWVGSLPSPVALTYEAGPTGFG